MTAHQLQTYIHSSFSEPETVDFRKTPDERTKATVIYANIMNYSDYPIVSYGAFISFNGFAQKFLDLTFVDEKDILINSQSDKNFRFILPIPTSTLLNPKDWNIVIKFTNIFDFTTIGNLFLYDLSANQNPDYKFRLARYSDVNPKEEDTPSA